ncbi:hypothetical protein P9209_20155 [Prescottella defluvii]|nr:hypothetical protein P9209_20155 [Prescottella defluvii]
MITHPAFPVEPWRLRATSLDFEVLAQAESLFTVSNGHLGWRGNLDEGDPHGLPGSYLSGVYEVRPMPYAEPGYGYPNFGETIINITDGKIVRLLIDDEPFDVRRGHLLKHEQELDLQAGVLRRTVEWCSPAGRTVRVRTTRIVSFTQRAIGAVDYRVESLDGPARVVLQSELVANEPMPEPEADPRAAAVLGEPLVGEENFDHDALVQPSTRPARAVCAWPSGWTTRCSVRTSTSASEVIPTRGGSRSLRSWRPVSTCGWSSTWPTDGLPAGRHRRCATRSPVS